jgi:hypothetical protein
MTERFLRAQELPTGCTRVRITCVTTGNDQTFMRAQLGSMTVPTCIHLQLCVLSTQYLYSSTAKLLRADVCTSVAQRCAGRSCSAAALHAAALLLQWL